jgi:hypothetical protein
MYPIANSSIAEVYTIQHRMLSLLLSAIHWRSYEGHVIMARCAKRDLGLVLPALQSTLFGRHLRLMLLLRETRLKITTYSFRVRAQCM